jgi:amidase
MLVGGKLGPLYADPARRALMKPEAQWEVAQSFQLTAAQLYQASVTRTAIYHAFGRLFERYDYLVAPSAQVFPFDAELQWPRSINGVAMDSYHRWMEIVTPFTLAGLPVASVPVGFGPGGLPMGMQVAGPPRADLRVLALARAWEQVSDWTQQLPPALR